MDLCQSEKSAQILTQKTWLIAAAKMTSPKYQQERERYTGYDTANDTAVDVSNKAVARVPCALDASKFIVKRGLIRVFLFNSTFP